MVWIRSSSAWEEHEPKTDDSELPIRALAEDSLLSQSAFALAQSPGEH